MNLSGIASLAASAELTLAEKGIASAKVVLTGFVVVFSMLILLILIIKVYSTIVAKAQQVGKTKKEKVTDVASATPAPAAKAASPAPVAQTAQGQIDDEVVAVISAAVATMYASPEKVRIKSIKKSNGGRNAWANAGLLNNTRPF